MTRQLNICLVAHFAYGELCGGSSGSKGGVEKQTSLMAHWLAGRGHKVSMIAWDEGQADGTRIDGVTVYKTCGSKAGVPVVRFVHPRWTSLVRALRRAGADVYYHNCAEVVTGQVAMWAGRHAKRFVFSVANDPECDPRLPTMPNMRARMLYRYGLTHADRIIAQTGKQRAALRDGFGLESTVIPMPCPGPTEQDFAPPQPLSSGKRVLWLARICPVKRPDRLLDVADAFPQLSFDMAGPVYDDAFSAEAYKRALQTPNVTVHGPVSRQRVTDLCRAASCFLSTSEHEGFPNTFLEAWSHGLPIVSTFDPDGLIESHGLGATADDVPALVAGLRRLVDETDHWARCSVNARRYYLENHQVDSAMRRFEQLFLEVAGCAPTGGRGQ